MKSYRKLGPITAASGVLALVLVFMLPAFTSHAQITITSFTPTSGPVGASVVINGTGFGTTPSNNIVFFGATQAIVSTATATQLTVTVPIGATYQPISVTRGGLTAYTNSPFVLTFTGGGTIDACAFAAKVDFVAGTTPNGMAISDLDGDGKTDIVMVNSNSTTVSTYLNSSTTGAINASSFAAKLDFPTGSFPIDVAIGDIDGDGKLDLAIVNGSGSSVSVLLNTSTTGSISFANKIDLPSGLTSNRLAIADLDDDGKPEIAVSNGLKNVGVLKNQSTPGSVSFAPKVDFIIYSLNTNPFAVAISDLDGDGKKDLAVTQSNMISVLRNTTSAGTIDATSFAPFVVFNTGLGGQDLAIGDLDGDLKPEMIVPNRLDNSISVFQNTSTPGIIDATSFATKVDFIMGSGGSIPPHSVVINDLDGDGKPDLAIGRSNSAVLSVFKNTSTPGVIDANSLALPVTFSTGPIVAFSPYRIAAGDLDGDGRSELVIGNNKVSVFRNLIASGPPPTITSFNPPFGLVGTTVTVTGTNFSTTAANNVVRFNNTPAVVTVSTATSITTTVPAGATTGPITVTIDCPTAISASNFYVGTCLPLSERNALIALYNATAGFQWTNRTNWLSADETTWFGVTISGCHVTGLSLPNNSLSGTLPVGIGDLPFLVNLDLSHNSLTGAIPNQVGNLSGLQTLNLGVNALFGTIPDALGSLTALTSLDLGSNQLTGDVPPSLAALPSLGVVSLWLNHLTSLPVFNSATTVQLKVEFNQLDFGDLEPNISVAGFTYDPQGQLPPGGTINFTPGSTVTIPFSTPGTSNSYQWYKDVVTPISGATSSTLTLPNTSASDVGGYTIQVTSSLVPGITLKSFLYLLYENPCPPGPRSGGGLDISFDPLNSDPSSILAIALQSSGKSIVSTPFGVFNSVPVNGIARFNTDGSLDNSFSVASYFPTDRQFLVQDDDKVLGVYSGTYNYVIRLNADGSDDVAFNSNVPQYYSSGINAIGIQPDGKILVSVFDSYATTYYIERLNSDGTPDFAFTSPGNLAATVINVQPDDYILVGGSFVGGMTRLDPTGAVDPGFNIVEGADDVVTDILLQPDGKIIVIGLFTHYNDNPHRGIVRLNPDGTEDTGFQPFGINQVGSAGGVGIQPNKAYLQADGKILIAGFFNDVNHANKISMVRLNTDGTIDCSFDTGVGPDGSIYDMAVQPDGDILIVGDFLTYEGTTRNGFARVKNGGASTITITNQPADASVCAGTNATFTTSATGTTNITYRWQFSLNSSPLSFADLTDNSIYSGTATSTLNVNTTSPAGSGRYRCRINGDLALEQLTNDEGLFINSIPTPPMSSNVVSCAPASVFLTGTGATNGQYRWYTVATGGTVLPGEVNATFNTPVISSTTTYYVSINNGNCESARTPVVATINILTKPVVITSNCTASSATLTGPAGFASYTWSNAGATQQITVTTAGSYSLTVTAPDGCVSPLSDVTTFTATFCNKPPAITPPTITTTVEGTVTVSLTSLLTDPDNNLDFSTLKIVTQPLSGALATIDASFNLLIRYSGVSFAGTDRLTLQICDVAGACVQKEFIVEVNGEITVFNAVSPNGDGKNDVFIIQYINSLPDTKNNNVTIYNRWGDVVFEIQDYDNVNRVFTGLNKNGNELPTGTYFYKLEFASTGSVKTGYLSLKR